MRVIVVGAGIAGLAVAQGLTRAGAEVTVLDRDRGPADTGGYRIHLDDVARRILQSFLLPDAYAAVELASSAPETFAQFTLADHRLRPLAVIDQAVEDRPLLIGRPALRRILTQGLTDLRFGSTVAFVDIESTAVRLTDGTSLAADVVVGADGPRSVIVAALDRQLGREPGAGVRRIPFVGIAGRCPLTGELDRSLPASLRHGPVLALAPSGYAVFVTRHVPRTPEGPYADEPCVVWGVNAAAGRFPRTILELGSDDALTVAVRSTRGFHPVVAAAIADTAAQDAAAFGFYAPDPANSYSPWTPGPVMALGDAVHAMPPTGGRGGSTAIRDAESLVRHLRSATRDETSICEAVRACYRDMADYAPQAVAESCQPLTWMRLLSRPLPAAIARVAFPVAAALRGGVRGSAAGTAPRVDR